MRVDPGEAMDRQELGVLKSTEHDQKLRKLRETSNQGKGKKGRGKSGKGVTAELCS
jgi:hypothetical protein